MKHKGSTCDFIDSRNKALRQEFLERLGRNGRTLQQVFDELARIPAPRFFISEERAYMQLKRYFTPRGGSPRETGAHMLDNTRHKLEDIRRRVKALMAANPGMELRDAVFEVVNGPAPSFYLTPRSIRTILYNIGKRRG